MELDTPLGHLVKSRSTLKYADAAPSNVSPESLPTETSQASFLICLVIR